MSPRTKLLNAAPLAAVLAIAGCGVQSAHEEAVQAKASAATSAPGAPGAVEARHVRFAMGTPIDAAGADQANADSADGGLGQPIVSTPPGTERKIIYDARVELVVEDFTGMPDRVFKLVKAYDAYVGSSDLQGASGTSRRATWTIRVPVERYEEFLGAAKGLGEVKCISTNSRDVSEEYYDVEARIRNKTKEEERLLKLLEERPGELKDVIAIERELSRVREELERMQGRMRVLADLTSLTTVTLSIEEIKNYQPPQAPTLATRARRAFESSAGFMRSTGEALVVAMVAATPWLPIAGVVIVPAYVSLRRKRRRTTA